MTSGGDQLRFQIDVPDQHPCFADHFPGDPLVPGALLLQWVVDQVSGQWPEYRVSGVPAVKFLSPVRPGCKLDTEVIFDGKGALVKLLNGDVLVCQGRLSFAEVHE